MRLSSILCVFFPWNAIFLRLCANDSELQSLYFPLTFESQPQFKCNAHTFFFASVWYLWAISPLRYQTSINTRFELHLNFPSIHCVSRLQSYFSLDFFAGHLINFELCFCWNTATASRSNNTKATEEKQHLIHIHSQRRIKKMLSKNHWPEGNVGKENNYKIEKLSNWRWKRWKKNWQKNTTHARNNNELRIYLLVAWVNWFLCVMKYAVVLLWLFDLLALS